MRPALLVRLLVAGVVAVTSFAAQGSPSTASAPGSVAAQTAGVLSSTVALSRTSDAELTTRLRLTADSTRHVTVLVSLFARQTYLSASAQMATALLDGKPVVAPPDNAPSSYIGGVTSAGTVDSAVSNAA